MRPRWWWTFQAGLACCGLALAGCAPAPDYDGDVPTVRANPTRSFGKEADVLTRDVAHGVPVLWRVRVDAPETVAATPDYPEVLCYPVTMVPTEIGNHPVDVTVAMPEFTMVDGEDNANFLEYPAEVCGETDNPPHGYTGDLEVGREYTTYVATWDGLYGIAGTGVVLTTPEQTVTWR